jgi:hypothetical protein
MLASLLGRGLKPLLVVLAVVEDDLEEPVDRVGVEGLVRGVQRGAVAVADRVIAWRSSCQPRPKGPFPCPES